MMAKSECTPIRPSMIIHKRITEHNELYLYMNGKIIYKKWLDTGASKVFDIMAYDRYTHSSYTDLDVQDSPFVIEVKAQLDLLSAEEGGRKNPIASRYHPDHIFEYGSNGQVSDAFMGEIILTDREMLEPGDSCVATIRLVLSPRIEQYLEVGRKWWIHEAQHLVAQAELLAFLQKQHP